MILADTSVWVDHLSRGTGALAALLDEEQVVMRAFVLKPFCSSGFVAVELFSQLARLD